MTEDRDRAKAPGSSREGPPPWLGALAEACGDELHRYCGGVLGDAEAERVAVLAFAQAVEQEARAERAGPVELEPLRATVLAMAHNRCVAEGRQERGSAPQHSRGSEDERRAMQALARLRPIGRDVSILRHGLGLRWDAMQRVCGEPPARLVLQVCRAWRRMAHLAQGRPGQPPVRRPGGRALSEREEDWAAIREDARAHAELRAALRRAVEHGEALLLLDPSEAAVHAAELEAERERDQHTGLVFSAPSSGRFYSRSSPDKPAFVTVGDVIEEGAPVALLEVMKTFHRIAYGGAGLPHRARVLAILANDGADLEVGDAILEVEQA